MIENNENNLRTISVNLGSLTADSTVPAVHLDKASVIKAVRLMNGAAISANALTHVALSLKNGDTVVASLDSAPSEQGAITKNEALAFAIVEGQEVQPAGSDLKLSYDETVYAGDAEVTRIVCRADTGGDLSGTGFMLYDEVGSVGVFFDNGNAGAVAPTDINAAARKIECNAQADDDTAEDIATALAAKLDLDAKFVAIVDPDDLTAVLVTASLVGLRTDAFDSADEPTAFDISVDTQGAAAASDVALTLAQLIIDFHAL